MSRFGQMTEAEKKAEEMRLKDAEMLQQRKKKFDAARFAHIENTNKVHGQPKPQPVPEPEQQTLRKESDAAKQEETKKKKKGWKIFRKKNKDSPTELVKESTYPVSTPKEDPPIAARSVKPENIPVEVAPNWAGVDKQNQRPQPNVGHSSDANFPRPATEAAIPKHAPTKNPAVPPELTRTTKPTFETVGYGTQGRKPKSNISSTIAAFQGDFKPVKAKPRNMTKTNVASSTSETIDAHGNITRTITKKITEPNGKTRTETEVVEIPAKR